MILVAVEKTPVSKHFLAKGGFPNLASTVEPYIQDLKLLYENCSDVRRRVR